MILITPLELQREGSEERKCLRPVFKERAWHSAILGTKPLRVATPTTMLSVTDSSGASTLRNQAEPHKLLCLNSTSYTFIYYLEGVET